VKKILAANTVHFWFIFSIAVLYLSFFGMSFLALHYLVYLWSTPWGVEFFCSPHLSKGRTAAPPHNFHKLISITFFNGTQYVWVTRMHFIHIYAQRKKTVQPQVSIKFKTPLEIFILQLTLQTIVRHTTYASTFRRNPLLEG